MSNEVINQKLYIENKKEYENKYELENYTDKLFNNIFDINIHFSAEDLTFTENEYIKQFLKEINITNARLINKIIENLEAIMKRDINKQKHKIIFLEILTAQYYIKNVKNVQCGCITHSKINLSYKVIQEIMQLTIFTYSWWI